MKIHFLSDVHNERRKEPYKIPQATLDACDVIVVAGDIDGDPERGIAWMESLGKPVVAVLGNHDLWSAFDREERVLVEDGREKLRRWFALAKLTKNVHLLERDAVVIGDTRFLGTTLWTDYGRNLQRYARLASVELMAYAMRSMNDFGNILATGWLSDPAWREPFDALYDRLNFKHLHNLYGDELERKWHPILAYLWHEEAIRFLRQELSVHDSVPDPDSDDRIEADWKHTVVVSHHAPSYRCLMGEVYPDALDPASWQVRLDIRWDQIGVYKVASYASNLSTLIERHADSIRLWIHGHHHQHVDTFVGGGVRIRSNPCGYGYEPAYGFDPTTIIDLDSDDDCSAMPLLKLEIADAVDGTEHDPVGLQKLLGEAKTFAVHERHEDPVLREASQEAVNNRLRKFHERGQDISLRIHDALIGSNRPHTRAELPGIGVGLEPPGTHTFYDSFADIVYKTHADGTQEPVRDPEIDTFRSVSKHLERAAKYLSDMKNIEALVAKERACLISYGIRAVDCLAELGVQATYKINSGFVDVEITIEDSAGRDMDELRSIVDGFFWVPRQTRNVLIQLRQSDSDNE